MPSFLTDAAGSPVFWIVLVIILAAAAGGYVVFRRQLQSSPAITADNSKVVQDWLPTGRIDFAGPAADPSAADTPTSFYLQAEEVRILVSMSGIERREIRWRRATLNEAKRVVAVFHRQLPRSSLKAVEIEPLHVAEREPLHVVEKETPPEPAPSAAPHFAAEDTTADAAVERAAEEHRADHD